MTLRSSLTFIVESEDHYAHPLFVNTVYLKLTVGALSRVIRFYFLQVRRKLNGISIQWYEC